MNKEQRIANQTQLSDKNVSILVKASNYNVEDDDRYLIPYRQNNKFGLINHDYEVILPAKYDYIVDTCYHKEDLLRIAVLDHYAYERKNKHPQIYSRYKYGVINTKGEFILPVEYGGILIEEHCFIVREAYGYNYTGKEFLIDFNGNAIIPYGKFTHFDPFAYNLSRCRRYIKQNGKRIELCGIVDVKGNIVLPCTTRKIMPFYGRYKNTYLKLLKELIMTENPSVYNYYFTDKEIEKPLNNKFCEETNNSFHFNGCYDNDGNFDYDRLNDAIIDGEYVPDDW